MAAQPGSHRLGPRCGRLIVRTFRDGLAAQAGHDLVIEIPDWSGELVISADGSPASLSLRVALPSLIVREGTGGLKPLTERDRREIAATALKTLSAGQNPEATFTATEFAPDGSGGGQIAGTLMLAGRSQPLRLAVAATGPDRYRVMTSVTQSRHGIKPYSGFLGALRVRDAVDIEADIDLSQTEEAAA
jgi:polyisoprenoid-binding protein YceI